MKIDLHVHTLYSDGVYSPEKIVDTALDVGLQAISLTDHDNILSYQVAQDYIKEKKEKQKALPSREIKRRTSEIYFRKSI